MNKMKKIIVPLLIACVLFAMMAMPAFASEGACADSECEGTYENGICSVCGAYEAAVQNEDGAYELGNAGQLLWFAEYVNSGNREADAVLVSDIDLQDKVWTPIGNKNVTFAGSFDGNGYAINNLTAVTSGTESMGVFGVIHGATVKNFSVSGDITIADNHDSGTYTGVATVGIAYASSLIDNVTSHLNISVEEDVTYVRFAAGIVGELDSSFIRNCSWDGIIDLGASLADQTGGIVAYVWTNGTSEISNCVSEGTFKINYAGSISVGGILGYARNVRLTYKNCLFMGSFELGENTSTNAISAFGMLNDGVKSGSKGLYYLESSAENGRLGNASLGSDVVIAVSQNQLASGEVAYGLGEGWGQELGVDELPLLGGKTVYYGYVCDESVEGKIYTNENIVNAEAKPEHIYDADCTDTDCNICGESREAKKHIYSDCYDESCNNEGCEYVRETPTHTYSHACDKFCDLCMAIRTDVAHKWDNSCDTECNVCGATRVITHTYDNACDAVCNVCEAERQVPEHVYTNVCDPDCDECGAKREASHTYDNACDTDCNACGAERDTEHKYAGDCDAHCDVCGEERETGKAHTYDNDCDGECNVCGATRETTGHVYYNGCDIDCNVCGAKCEASAHVYDNDCDAGCNLCRVERQIEGHKYDDDNDEICNVCGHDRKEDEKSDDKGDEDKSGCGSSIGVTAAVLVTVFTVGTGMVFRKKEEQ